MKGVSPRRGGRCYQRPKRHTAANAVRGSHSAWSAHRSAESGAAVCAANALPATHVARATRAPALARRRPPEMAASTHWRHVQSIAARVVRGRGCWVIPEKE
jgi:hypothetical protein